MEIGLTYYSKDPKHKKTRDFLFAFIRDRGILANVIENDREVKTPRITVNGCSVTERSLPSDIKRPRLRFPSTKAIARALEQNFWSL